MKELYVFYIAAVIVFGICFVMLSDKGLSRRNNKLLFMVNLNGLLASLVLEMNQVISPFYDINLISLYLYHAIHVVFIVHVFLYAVDICGRWYSFNKTKMALTFAPIGIFYLILLSNPLTKLAFTVEDGVYHRGNGILVEYVIAIAFLILTIYMIIKYHKAIGIRKVYEIILFIALSLIGVGIQFVYPEIKCELFFEAVAVFSICGFTESEGQVRDPITGLYNRALFGKDVEQFIKAKVKYNIVLVRMGNFSHLNNTVGYTYVNEMLTIMAVRLQNVFGKGSSLYYLSGGAFAYISNSSNKDIDEYVEQIKEQFEESIVVGGYNIPSDINVVCLRVPEDADSLNTIIMFSDSIRKNYEHGVQVYKGEKLEKINHKMKIEKALREGLVTGTYSVYYQPIYDNRTGKVHSAEALSRLIDPKMGFIPPDEFIAVAEESDLIFEVGEEMFRRVCQDIAKGDLRDCGIDFIEINLSPVQLMKKNIAEDFKNIMKEYNVTTDDINLEITESTAERSEDIFIENYIQLKDAGFSFSLDDYGTGLSNMSSILNMQFKIIKIDKSILWDAQKNHQAKIVFESISEMFKNMGLEIVTEGAETKEHVDYISGLGIEYCQGFYFSKPIPYEEFVEFCKKRA